LNPPLEKVRTNWPNERDFGKLFIWQAVLKSDSPPFKKKG
jgi:hypothetical protein